MALVLHNKYVSRLKQPIIFNYSQQSECSIAMPLYKGISSFIIRVPKGEEDIEPPTIYFVTSNEERIALPTNFVSYSDTIYRLRRTYFCYIDASELPVGECGHLEIGNPTNRPNILNAGDQYSALVKVQHLDDRFALVSYSCDEDAFDLPFLSLDARIQGLLPIHIINPQFKTEDEVYETLDGDHKILYAAYAEEYELETEFIPYEWHTIIITALCCDHISINGVSVYKSSEYTIDWDNYTLDGCGNKLVRATCKVLVNHRDINSNGGDMGLSLLQ